MRGLHTVLNHFRHIKGNRAIITGVFALGLLGFGGFGIADYTKTQAMVRNCDANSIINCGVGDAAEFKQKYDANATGDLATIYNHYWIPRDIQVVQGTSYKDGTVKVNGKTVATNATSIGRQAIPGSRPISIGGKTYYETPNSAAFKTDALPTMVALDANGNFKYAIINACGNPVYAKPTPPPTPPTPPKETPKYTCDQLNIEHISNTKKRLTYSASAAGGAQLVNYRIDFGDGISETTTATTIEHDYTKTGAITARVTAKFNVNGVNVDASSANCAKSFDVKQPAEVACVALQPAYVSGNKYNFTIKKTETNATYTGANMNYGDGTSEDINGTTATHEYASAGNYTITATLKFTVDGTTQSKTCQASVQPCEYDGTLPKESPECKKPVTPASIVELPKTGPGSMLMGGFGIASVIIASSFYISSKRDLLASLLQR